MNDAFHLDEKGAIAAITLTNPKAHNSLSQDTMNALRDTLGTLAARQDLRGLILTGEGKSFCAGASLGDVDGADWNENPLTTLCDTLEAFPRPVICALNGGVYGGGVEIALACDFRIGPEGMKMFVPPAKLGIHYEAAGIHRAVTRLGPQIARRLFLRAETFLADDLLKIGFLDALVVPDAVQTTAQDWAEGMAALAPMAISGMKRTIHELATNTLDTAAAKARVAACFASDDHQEGLKAMKEKRPPKFEGR